MDPTQEQIQEPRNKSSLLNIPTAIVIAGAIVAGAVIYAKAPINTGQVATVAKSLEQSMKPVTSADHILGNPTAKIKIVEYSDPSCPFCKAFHSTMKKVIDTYGKNGDVAWVYRHFPLDKVGANGRILHPNAGHEAQALECAGSLGGNEKFWAYANRFYEITPSVTPDSPNGLDQNQLPKIAQFVGINITDFNNCLISGKFKDKIEAQFTDGVNIGIQGTPSSIIITPSGKYIPLEGAQPYENVKQVIDALLAEQPS